MTDLGRGLRQALIALGAFWAPGLGHLALGRRRTGGLLAVAGLAALPVASAFALLPLHRLTILALLGLTYLPHAISLIVYLRVSPSAPAPLAMRPALLCGFAIMSLLLTIPVRNSSREHLAHPFKIPSASMEPTLLRGDQILADCRSSGRRAQQGDVIVFRLPSDRSEMYVKRVIATGGDQIEIRDRVVVLNGQPLNEPYVLLSETPPLPGAESPRDNLSPVRVPAGALFVMGDRRDDSNDSRFWGFLAESDVVGRVTGAYFSLDSKTREVRWERIGRTVRELEALARSR